MNGTGLDSREGWRSEGYNYNIIMETLRFEWDPQKDLLNRTMHGVSFA